MTVCIAARFRHEGIPGLVLVHDDQITDDRTAFKSRGLKIAKMGNWIGVLGAGDMSHFSDLIERCSLKLRNQDRTKISVREAAKLYLESEIDWQNEYRELHVLSKYGLTWETYFQKLENNALPEAFFAEVNADLKALQMPCKTDVIIAGIDDRETDPEARIIKIEDGIPDDMGKDGFAVIGEGNSIALTEFGYAAYSRFWDKAETLLLAYVAKRRSEAIASVGSEENIMTITPSEGMVGLPPPLKVDLLNIWLDLKKERDSSEKTAYERAKQKLKEFEKVITEITETSSEVSQSAGAGDH